MVRRDHVWGEENTYVSTDTFGIPKDIRRMEVVTPTNDEDYIRLCGMLCAFAYHAKQYGIPFGALHIRGTRPPPDTNPWDE